MSRDLDTINPAIASASQLGSFCAALPLLSGCFGLILALGAIPEAPLSGNVLAMACCAVCLASLVMLFIPRVFGWKWKAQHFGAVTFYLGSLVLPGMVLWLSFLMHGAPPLAIRGLLFAGYAGIVLAWAWRFVTMYRDIFADVELRRRLYQMEGNHTYYMQRGDKLLCRLKGFPDHFPSVWLLLGSVPLGFALLLIAPEVGRWTGISPLYVPFMVICLPWDMTFFSMALRGWLLFYFYPNRIFKETATRVYVDMTTSPGALPRQQRRARRQREP